jgi:hypothetical protein
VIEFIWESKLSIRILMSHPELFKLGSTHQLGNLTITQ